MSATATAAPRTRRIETKTIDEVPVSGYKPLDAPWEEFLARLADNPDLAAITRVNLYRREPAANRGWLVEVQEPIDEKWIARNFGGGSVRRAARSASLPSMSRIKRMFCRNHR